MKTQVTQEDNSSQQQTTVTSNQYQTVKQGATVGKTGISGKPIASKYKQPIQAKTEGGPIPARRPVDKTPPVSSNTRKKEKRQKEREKKEPRKKGGLLAISEPEEFKKAVTYLKQSATATKVIDYLEGLSVIIGVHTRNRGPEIQRTGYQVGKNNIRWFSNKGVVIGDSKTETEKYANPKVIGYMSPAMALWHEMLHAAIEHGYLEKYDLKLDKNVDTEKYHNAEHKFIIEMEHKVIDELKAADKNIKETKRETYHGGIGNAFFDNATSASDPKNRIFDIYSKPEYIEKKNAIKKNNSKYADLLKEYR